MNVASLFVGAGEIKELSALKKFGIILNEDKEINVLEKLIGKGVNNDNALKLINKLDVEELKKLHSFLEKKPS
ncbi:hypothetical protein, partial [Clostridium sp. HBUAS56017]|uniref:hypothetical protein n=1 Tax=Clostridium sp. HBUAS56017 TaxID=2571128 RepID=UPI00163D719E